MNMKKFQLDFTPKTPEAPEGGDRYSPDQIKTIVGNIQDVFGLNLVELTTVLGIARQTLHNHVHGKGYPVNIDDYLFLSETADIIGQRIDINLKPGSTTHPIDGRTLYEYLVDTETDQNTLIRVALELAHYLRSRPRGPRNRPKIKRTHTRLYVK